MRGSVFIATSLDGFIARPDGGIDWLTTGEAPGGDGGDGEAYGYREFFNSVDALVMGRNTYELVRTFGAWPYEDKPVVVLTSRGVEIPPELTSKVTQMGGEPGEIARRLGERGYSHLYIDGGATIQGFLRAGLIQQMTVTRIPVLIGRGIPLFGPLERDIRWRHLETHAFENGFVQSRYEILT